MQAQRSTRPARAVHHPRSSFLLTAAILLVLNLLLQLTCSPAAAGGGNKGKGGGEEDIIMYNGNIVLRGDKEGGNIVMAGMHPTNEEVEFAPSFFQHAFGEMGRRRR